MPYSISEECVGCGVCSKKCPEGAIQGERKVRFHIDPGLCQECGACFDACPQGAVIDPHGNRPAKKSKKKKIVKAHIDPGTCAGCKNCFLNCPQKAITIVKRGILSVPYCRVNPKTCVGCGICAQCCITGAVELE